MKILLMLIGCLTANLCFAQVGDPYHSWNFSYGRTGTPGDQLKIGLEYAKADKTAFITEAGVELSRYRISAIAVFRSGSPAGIIW